MAAIAFLLECCCGIKRTALNTQDARDFVESHDGCLPEEILPVSHESEKLKDCPEPDCPGVAFDPCIHMGEQA